MLRIRFREKEETPAAETAPVRINTPPWEGPLRAYATNYVKANAWRYAGKCEVDDLLQEAWIVYFKVERAYPHVVNPRHFMGLYKSALRNHFINYDRALNRFPALLSTLPSEGGGDGAYAPEHGTSPAALCSRLAGGYEGAEEALFRDFAPAPVRRLIDQLVTGEVEMRYEWHDNVRETTRDFLNRVAGCDPATPIVELVLHYTEGQKPKEI